MNESQARTKDRLDNLILENSQLRKKLLLRSEEFCQYRSSIESTGAKTIRSYREKVMATLTPSQTSPAQEEREKLYSAFNFAQVHELHTPSIAISRTFNNLYKKGTIPPLIYHVEKDIIYYVGQ